MSYKPTPKTSYGDTDFSDDSWSPQSNSSNQPPSSTNYGVAPPYPTHQQPRTDPRGMTTSGMSQMAYNPGQAANPQYANMNAMQGQTGQPVNPITALRNSITQEDILFMRSWQRDSFFNRVIPVEVVGLGSLYMYNRTKGIPHSIPKYMAMASVAFIFGKWTYRNEFKRRLAESPLNTPYMQALRKNLGLAPVTSSEFTTDPPEYGGNNEFERWQSGGGGTAYQPATYSDDRQFGSGSGGPPPSNYDLAAFDRLDNQTNDDVVKPRVTYDELRARNRGFIK